MANQTTTVEFLISGSADGTTVAPNVLPPRVPGDQIFRFEVVDLGLINIGFGGDSDNNGAAMTRYITSLLVYPYSAAPPPVAVDVVAAADPAFSLQSVIALSPPTGTGIYVPGCIMVPQGFLLKIDGFASDVGPPSLLRMDVGAYLESDTIPYAKDACCCMPTTPRLAPLQLGPK